MQVILEVQRGSKKAQSIRLRGEETIVGRQDGADLRIPSAAVSRRHCRLSFRDDVLTVEDLDSSNGTFVNGARVTGVQVVQPGDRLEIGPVTFLVKYHLTQAAIDRLLGDGALPTQEGDEDVPEAEELCEVESVEEELAPKDRATVQFQLGDTKEEEKPTGPKKRTTKKHSNPESKEDKPAEELPQTVTFDDEGPWKLPQDEDFRDILSRLEDP